MEFQEDNLEFPLQTSSQDFALLGNLIQALNGDEESWKVLSQEMKDQNPIEIKDETLSINVDEFFNQSVVNNNNDNFQIDFDDYLTKIKTKSEENDVDCFYSDKNNNCGRIPSELYSPKSLSRSTSPESNYEYDFDSSLKSNLIAANINNYDKKIAQKIHEEETLANTLMFYQTSQGNNHLSQSQKQTADAVETEEIKVTIKEEVKTNERKRKTNSISDQSNVENETACSSRSKKRKTEDFITVKRNHNKEAAKRYRSKKKTEFEADRQLKEQLAVKNKKLRDSLKDAIKTRIILCKLMKAKYKEQLKMPIHINLGND